MGNGICAEENSLTCNNYATVLGCTWSEADGIGLKAVCKWDSSVSECVDSPECGSLKGEGLTCENYKSQKGSCFFNGDSKTTTNENSCSDSMDITNCNQLASVNLCTFANKDFFPKLYGILQNPCTFDANSNSCKAWEEGISVDSVCI
jgi:hypothetical protein